jgi:hypothetical protein
MGAAWKTIPLFISSKFRDMHAERDQLNRVVFPAIEERLKERRCRLEPIDLRAGVETDSTKTERERELQILKVCLAEIERSRPFLLVLLGERYGWVLAPGLFRKPTDWQRQEQEPSSITEFPASSIEILIGENHAC